ncbi:UNVERIFIED_ORG: EAL domain-containing protein (putative c-di-GMP-specific phosphodiesterase class I) [Martelella mediterranea]
MTAARPSYVTIDNLDDIVLVYGSGAGERVLVEVACRLDDALVAGSQGISVERWGIVFNDSILDLNTASQVEKVVHGASLLPINILQGKVVAALSTLAVRPHEDVRLSTASPQSGADYRADMHAAATAYEALSEGCVAFAEQAIRNAAGNGTLYDECQARFTCETGERIAPAAHISALERIGLTGAFDKWVVEATVDKLRSRAGIRLGCNLSGLSARVDNWWLHLFPHLLKNRSLAERLVLEITETARPYSLKAGAGFVEMVHLFGCRVALDDFGAGFSSIGFARDAKFDIIKIDGSYVRRQVAGEHTGSMLDLLVKLAHAVGADVVVEGIETSDEQSAALETEARWLQGYYIDRSVAALPTAMPVTTFEAR